MHVHVLAMGMPGPLELIVLLALLALMLLMLRWIF